MRADDAVPATPMSPGPRLFIDTLGKSMTDRFAAPETPRFRAAKKLRDKVTLARARTRSSCETERIKEETERVARKVAFFA